MVIRSLALLLTLVLCPGWLVQQVAEAQDQAPQEVSERRAKELFQAGTAALVRQDYAAARPLLEEALALHPHPATAYNLAVAELNQQQIRAAVARLEEILAADYGALDPARQKEVSERLAEARRRLATIVVRIAAGDTQDIQVDAQPSIAWGERDVLHIVVDPGRHAVRARSRTGEEDTQHVDVKEGSSVEVSFSFQSEVDRALGPQVPVRSEEQQASSAFPWAWVIAGVVVVGAGTAAIVLLSQSSSEPYSDPVFGRIEALSF